MIKATTRFDTRRLSLRYSDFSGGHDRSKPVTVAHNAKGDLLISGECVKKRPQCDGDDLCGQDARYVVTMLQHHEVSFQSQVCETVTTFKNFILLCPDCMKLYVEHDTYLGEPLDLINWLEHEKQIQDRSI